MIDVAAMSGMVAGIRNGALLAAACCCTAWSPLAAQTSADAPLTPTVHAQHIAAFYCGQGQPDPDFGGTRAELATWQEDPTRQPVEGLGTPGKRWPGFWLDVVSNDGANVCRATWDTDETMEEVLRSLGAFRVTSVSGNGATLAHRASRPCCDRGEARIERLSDTRYRLTIPAETRVQ